MKVCLLAISTFLMFFPTAHALDSSSAQEFLRNINPGGYSEFKDYRWGGDKIPFRILVRGSEVRFVDEINHLTYPLNLSAGGDQDLPQAYIDFLHTAPPMAGLGRLIKKITISNIERGTRPAEIRARVTITLEYKSGFGSARAVVQLEASAHSGTCVFEHYTYDSGIYKTEVQNDSCIDTHAGDHAQLVSLSTSFGGFYDRFTALLMDFGLKLASPGMIQSTKIYEQK